MYGSNKCCNSQRVQGNSGHITNIYVLRHYTIIPNNILNILYSKTADSINGIIIRLQVYYEIEYISILDSYETVHIASKSNIGIYNVFITYYQ